MVTTRKIACRSVLIITAAFAIALYLIACLIAPEEK